MIIKTLIACVVWIGLVLGADYLVTKLENDAIDAKFGMLAGSGAVLIVAVSVLRAKRAKNAKQ